MSTAHKNLTSNHANSLPQPRTRHYLAVNRIPISQGTGLSLCGDSQYCIFRQTLSMLTFWESFLQRINPAKAPFKLQFLASIIGIHLDTLKKISRLVSR